MRVITCRRVAIIALAAAIVCGCVSPPKTYSVQNSSSVPDAYNVVWTRLMQWFTSSQVQIKTIDKASGVIYAERASVANTDYADCGSPGIATPIARPISMNVFVQPVNAQQTRVTITVTVTETRSFDKTVFQVSCNSTGRLEREMLLAASNRKPPL
jgi:hypothetical protein